MLIHPPSPFPPSPIISCILMEGEGGTVKSAYTLLTLLERIIEIKKSDIYLYIISYTKTHCSVKHDKVIQLLIQVNIDRKGLRLTKNINCEQISAI